MNNDEIELIDSLNTGNRLYQFPLMQDHKYYPFKAEYWNQNLPCGDLARIRYHITNWILLFFYLYKNVFIYLLYICHVIYSFFYFIHEGFLTIYYRGYVMKATSVTSICWNACLILVYASFIKLLSRFLPLYDGNPKRLYTERTNRVFRRHRM